MAIIPNNQQIRTIDASIGLDGYILKIKVYA